MKLQSILVIIALLFLASCGSSETGKKVVDKDQAFYWIENDDFEPVQPVRFEESDDHYTGKIEKQNSVAVETLAKIPPSQLMNIVEDDDPISKPVSLCYQGNFVAAFNIFDRNYKKYKEHATYWNQIGTCYYLQGKYKKAKLYYEKARELVKGYAPAFNNIGLIFYQNGEKQKAVAAFKKAYELNPFAVTPAYNMAMYYLEFGFITKAEPLLIALYKKNRKDQDVLNALGHLYMMKGQFNKSITFFSGLDQTNLNKPQVALSLSYALFKAKKPKKAQVVLAQAESTLTPKYSEYFARVSKEIRGR